MKCLFLILLPLVTITSFAQLTDSTKMDTVLPEPVDTTLRILNLNPYIAQHVDSSLIYQFNLNRTSENYHWFLRNAPLGLQIQRNTGLLRFKADKAYFLSGKLKYDQPYHVQIGVENPANPADRLDTSFSLLFYNTEIIPSQVKPTIASPLILEEGETVSFMVQCETGSFPIESILFSSNQTITGYTLVSKCNDAFQWTPNFDFVKESDSARTKIVVLSFIGNTKYRIKDTATVRLIVKDALNYPLANQQYDQLKTNIETYLLQLKYSFIVIDRRVRNNKKTRTGLDLTTAATSMSGTVITASDNTMKAGKILPGIGLSLVPVKEAIAPNKIVEQNQASLLRTSIRRLEYQLSENLLVGSKDPDILKKTNRLKEELRQTQVQLIDIPVELTTGMTKEDLDKYFNSPRISKKYRIKK